MDLHRFNKERRMTRDDDKRYELMSIKIPK